MGQRKLEVVTVETLNLWFQVNVAKGGMSHGAGFCPGNGACGTRGLCCTATAEHWQGWRGGEGLLDTRGATVVPPEPTLGTETLNP